MVWMTLRLAILWLGALAISVSAGCGMQPADTAVLKPGQDIRAIVEDSSEGTRFLFEPGIYRQQTIFPKDRQEFIGQDGVIISGAMELTTWKKEAGFWNTESIPAPLATHGKCERDLCALREDLFFNGRLYERVGSLDELAHGMWFYENGQAYLADDPTGQLVELGVTPLAFGGSATHVVLRDLIVEKYASAAQEGAIDIRDGRAWVLSNITARWNHGIGLYIGPETHIHGGSFSYNGQMGMGGKGSGSTIEGVEIAFNNYAGYKAGWEAGGTKFTRTAGLVVRNSCVHHNDGPGLWTDIDNIDVLYEGNTVFSNANDGIKHEISYDAVIRNNVVANNGYAHDIWLWGSQILIQNSQNVEVYGNFAEVSDEFGNGISVVHQDRGEGKYGPWNGVNNYVHHNTMVHIGDRGQSGVVRDADEDWFWNEAGNRFDWNSYVVLDGEDKNLTFNNRGWTLNTVKRLGLELNGQLSVERRTPIDLSCDQ